MQRLHLSLVGVIILSLWAPSGLALLEEGTSFEPSHEGVDFPVGWTEYNLGGPFSPQVRMVYPAMFDGEDKDMAGNGPFSGSFSWEIQERAWTTTTCGRRPW